MPTEDFCPKCGAVYIYKRGEPRNSCEPGKCVNAPAWNHGEKPFADLSESGATLWVPKPERVYDIAFLAKDRPLLIVHGREDQRDWIDSVLVPDVQIWPSGRVEFGPNYSDEKSWKDLAEILRNVRSLR